MGDLRPRELWLTERDEAGTHFDPAIVAAFLRIPYEELRGIAQSNQISLLLGPEPASIPEEPATPPTLHPSART